MGDLADQNGDEKRTAINCQVFQSHMLASLLQEHATIRINNFMVKRGIIVRT
jgi:hypothetical protein